MIHPIHQTEQEKQAHATESTTEAVNIARETLSQDLQNKAKSSDIKEVVEAIKNIPEVKIPEPKDFPDMSDKFDDIINAVKAIPKTIIPESKDFPKIPEFPKEIEMSFKGLSTITLKGEKGDSIKGEKGDSYILTETDKKEIAKKIKVPIIEKVIEKTEIIKEQPIITNEIKEIAITDTGEQIIDKLNPLKNKLDFEILTNIPDFALSRDITGFRGVGGGQTITFQDEGTRITDNPITTFNVTGTVGALTYSGNGVATLDITGVATDEKVKYDAGDTTAGYVADKVIAGTGMSIAEGAGANENKLVVTNSSPDQTVAITDSGVAVVTGTYPNFDINVPDQTYTLPTAAVATLGGVKVGDRLSIALGVLSADVQTTDISGKLNLSGGTMTGGIVLVAGTTTVQPLKMVAGTNLTTPVSGVFEYDGTNLFFSIA